jgi:ketosteroid isomerase-like protein
MLQPDPDAREGDIVATYQAALAAGDVEGVVAAFEPDASVREPAGSGHVHAGTDELRTLFTRFFSNGGGIQLEHCTVTDDGRACAIEYNVVSWGLTKLPPQAGVAVYVRGESGKLAAARIYDDVDPPL